MSPGRRHGPIGPQLAALLFVAGLAPASAQGPVESGPAPGFREGGATSSRRGRRRRGRPDLAPTLTRRFTVEDEPMVFRAEAPVGVPLGPRAPGRSVGEPGVRYRFDWRLVDPEGAVLRQAAHARDEPSDTWETAGLLEPYQPSFEGRLEVRLAVTYLAATRPVARGVARFPVLRVKDRTPPFQASQGDEEAYPAFEAQALSVRDGGVVTTGDAVVGADGQAFSRSPFRAIVDEGEVAEGDVPGRSTLAFSWENAFDNMNPPFTGPSNRSIQRFGLYCRSRWDLGGSHPLVTEAEGPYMAGARTVIRPAAGEAASVVHLVDLTSDLGEPPPQGGAWGKGSVRVPVPYDRVGEVEFGYYAEDAAWPAGNQALVPVARYRVEDDIAPVLVFTLRRRRGGEDTWVSADAVNRRWTAGQQSFAYPQQFGGPPLPELAELALKVQTAYDFHVLGFENTRLTRAGVRLTLEGPPGARGHGIRAPGSRARRTEWEVPVDGFDPAMARTQQAEPPVLYFSVPGEYALVLQADDIHGNARQFRLVFQAGEREFDRIRVHAEGVRARGGR